MQISNDTYLKRKFTFKDTFDSLKKTTTITTTTTPLIRNKKSRPLFSPKLKFTLGDRSIAQSKNKRTSPLLQHVIYFPNSSIKTLSPLGTKLNNVADSSQLNAILRVRHKDILLNFQ